MVNFPELPKDIRCDLSFKLNDYIKKFDLTENYDKIQFKIADLGFARKLAEDQLSETMICTPNIMAPECYFGLYDHRADVWSLGILYFQMIYGFDPFLATN